MKAWHFSEIAYHYLPPSEQYESIRVTLPNRYYDPKKGAELYDRFIAEWQFAEEMGMDIMIKEHHQTATCVDPGASCRRRRLPPRAARSRAIQSRTEASLYGRRGNGVRRCAVRRTSRGWFVRGVPWEISA
jgi:hypothetical protein